jgi:DNA helicase II / ATP-dependent DNA helicase PcrA
MDISSLNPMQKKAVTTTQGRVLILAGAGSGKTKVLTLRMAYLIHECRVAPESILGLTFTNKAAAEMRGRLALLIGTKMAKKVTLSTFHSFCMYLLRKEAHHVGYTTNFTLFDRQDIQRLTSAIARDVLEHEGHLPSLAKTLDAIALFKNKGIRPEDIQGTGSKWHDQFARQVAGRLQDAMRAYNALDFDHLLWLAVELFEKCPDVLERYQARFQYVMIDEYQDTNPIQSRLAKLLTQKSNNLCVVGDDDQSIYSWRGADVANILRFDEAVTIKLEQNYRSTNTILRAANNVIGKNTKRHQKALWSDKGDGEKIEIFYAPNEVCEAEAVVDRLVKCKEERGLKWKDFAILYRSNALSRPLESALLRRQFLNEEKQYRGIPYQVYGGDEFYEHKEVKDLLGYLRVVVNPLDHEALLRIINYPRRGIGEKTLDLFTQEHRKTGVPLWELFTTEAFSEQIPEKARQGIREFIALIEWAKKECIGGDWAKVLRELIVKINFKKAIFEEVKSEAMRKWKLENVQELVSSLESYQKDKERQEPENRDLADFLLGCMLDEEAKAWADEKETEEDHVHLMTFHSAKGLEFPVCFLVGLEDHLIPHEKSIQEGDVEEERRLMYVAMTRAKEYLVMSMATSRKRMGSDTPSKPSRFLFEIPKELLHITKWN